MSGSVFSALDSDWERFVASPAARDALEQWQSEPLLVAGGLGELVERIWATDRDRADQHLAALACRAADDHVAARVLLQALRPGLRALTARLGHGRGRVDQELVAIAWELICTYPIERRPRSIAANVLLDARKRYVAVNFGNGPWINLEDLAGTSALLLAVPSAEDEAIESEAAGRQRVRDYLAATTADGTISATAADVIWRTRIAGETDIEVADSVAAPVRSLQRRRQRAERRLATADPALGVSA